MRPYTEHIFHCRVSSPKWIEVLRELEVPARELVPFRLKSTAGFDLSPK